MANNILRVCNDPVEISGVTYFRLVSQYPGDQTKNCGLVGSEIDRNFYFLRGNDIESIEIVGEELVLKKVDGTELKVDLIIEEPDRDRPTITFDGSFKNSCASFQAGVSQYNLLKSCRDCSSFIIRSK